MVRKPQYPLSQIINRLTENKESKVTINDIDDILMVEHFDSPVHEMNNESGFNQFRKHAQHSGWDSKNSYRLINEDFASVKNFIKTGVEIFVVYQKFCQVESFYSYPFDTKELYICNVSRLSKNIFMEFIANIINKIYLISDKEKSTALPLIHCNQIIKK